MSTAAARWLTGPVARLEQAGALAAEQWPEPPPSIVITSAADRRAFQGCFEQAEGFEGQPLYRTICRCQRDGPAPTRPGSTCSSPIVSASHSPRSGGYRTLGRQAG